MIEIPLVFQNIPYVSFKDAINEIVNHTTSLALILSYLKMDIGKYIGIRR